MSAHDNINSSIM